MLTAFESSTCVTGGLDIGARSVKLAILSHSGAESAVLAKSLVQISGCGDDARETRTAILESWRQVLREANLSAHDVDLMASTGAGARPTVRVGQIYGQSSHALGARLLFPDGTVALDLQSLTMSEEVVLTGGMVRDAGFVQSLWRELLALDSRASLLISPEATFAGAYGAAILAARRFARISRPSIPGFTDSVVARLPIAVLSC